MLLRQRIKMVADAAELLNLVQDRTRMHGVRRFPESLRRENLQIGMSIITSSRARPRNDFQRLHG
jgi:hypothetical protein